MIPFTSAYQPFGLGAVVLDLVAALIITSLVRSHLPRRTWRGIHWLAYAAWPIALVHGVGASPDLRWGGLLMVTIICGVAVGAAVVWRVAEALGEVPRAERAADVLARSERPGQGPAGRRPSPQPPSGQEPSGQELSGQELSGQELSGQESPAGHRPVRRFNGR